MDDLHQEYNVAVTDAIEPLLTLCDDQLDAVQGSQNVLSSRLEELNNKLEAFNGKLEGFPSLQSYTDKLTETKKKVVTINEMIIAIKQRLQRVEGAQQASTSAR